MKKKKMNIFNKTNIKISILMDSIKGFFIVLIILIGIVFFASSIIHNILKILEVSDENTGKYNNLYYAGDGMVNIFSEGNGDKTFVILPQIGNYSPVVEYKALADSLSNNYKVVIVEPLGYGYSLSTKEKRTSKNVVNELRDGLKNAGIEGPYTLLAFSNSSIYAEYYSQKYPDEVNGIITINAIYPESLKSETFKNKYLPNVISNVKFYSMVSVSGLFRWQSYISPSTFSIDKMQSNNSYSKEEIEIYRNRIANRFLTKEMKNECYKLQDNMKELADYKFNENLPTIQIITTSYRDEYLERAENISKYATNLITNKDIQKVRTVEGEINDYLLTDNKIKDLKSIIKMYY